MNANGATRSFEDFDPSFEWSRGEESDILRVNLPVKGFKREHVKVQVDNNGNLRTSGECPMVGLGTNRWSRFSKDFSLPSNCRVDDIRAKMENQTLNITLPKDTTSTKPAAPNELPNPSAPPKPVSVPEVPKPAPVPDSEAQKLAPVPDSEAQKPAPAPDSDVLKPARVPDSEPQKPAPPPEIPKQTVAEPKPTVDQASTAPPSGNLGEMHSTNKEDKVEDNAKGTTASSIGDNNETEKKKEQKPVEETEKPPISVTFGEDPSKESSKTSQVLTGLQGPRWGLRLTVALALVALVGIGFYLSSMLRKAVVDGDHSNTDEL